MDQKTVIIVVLFVAGVLALPFIIKKMNEPPLPRITLEQYFNAVRGMTYPEVVETLGRDGIRVKMTIDEVMALKGVEGKIYSGRPYRTFEVYGWKNTKGTASGDDPRLFFAFIDGRVAAKYQTGLY